MKTPASAIYGDDRLIRQLLAPNCSKFTLGANANHPCLLIRCLVAAHPKTGARLLAHIASDDDSSVRACVAANANTHAFTRGQLSNDPDPFVKEAASRPALEAIRAA